jgi:nucleolin
MKKFVIGVVMAALIIGGGYLFFNNQTKEVEKVAENTVTEQKEEVAKEPGQKENHSAESEDKATKEFAEIKKELEKEGVDVELALHQIEENSHKVVVPKLSIDGGVERDENGKVVPSEGSGIIQSEDIDKVSEVLKNKNFDIEKVSKKIADGESVDSNDKKEKLDIVVPDLEIDNRPHKIIDIDDLTEEQKKILEVKVKDSTDTESKSDSNTDTDKGENTSKEDTSTSSNTSSSSDKEESEDLKRAKEIIKHDQEERDKRNNEYVPEEKEFVPSEDGSSMSDEAKRMIEKALEENVGEMNEIDISDEGCGTGDKF